MHPFEPLCRSHPECIFPRDLPSSEAKMPARLQTGFADPRFSDHFLPPPLFSPNSMPGVWMPLYTRDQEKSRWEVQEPAGSRIKNPMPQCLLQKVFVQTCVCKGAGVPGKVWPSRIRTQMGKGWRSRREKGRSTNYTLRQMHT